MGEEHASTVFAQTCRSPAGFLTEEYIFSNRSEFLGKPDDWASLRFLKRNEVKARLLLAALYIETSCFPNVESLETMRSLETALTIFKLPDVVGESGGSQRGGG